MEEKKTPTEIEEALEWGRLHRKKTQETITNLMVEGLGLLTTGENSIGGPPPEVSFFGFTNVHIAKFGTALVIPQLTNEEVDALAVEFLSNIALELSDLMNRSVESRAKKGLFL